MARVRRGGSLAWRRAVDVVQGEFLAVPAGTLPPAVLEPRRVEEITATPGARGMVGFRLGPSDGDWRWVHPDDIVVVMVGMDAIR